MYWVADRIGYHGRATFYGGGRLAVKSASQDATLVTLLLLSYE
jgi:hypothetical protein